MSFILPSDLTASFMEELLDRTAMLIIELDGYSRRVTVSDIESILLTMVQEGVYLTESSAANWTTPLDSISSTLSECSDTIHVHVPSEIGLDEVANVSPMDLPVSTAQQEALDSKLAKDALYIELQNLTFDTTPEW